jgi:hypothetical protein
MADSSFEFDRIKRNVQKMMSMSAPEADIDGYLATQRLSPDEFKSIVSGQAKLGDVRMTQKSQASIGQAKTAGANPNLATFSQGALQGYGDEMIGAVEAAKSGFQPGVYTQNRDLARQWLDAAQAESTSGTKLAGNLTTGIPAALLTGGRTLLGAAGSGAGLGGLSAYGETAGNDMQAVQDVALGSAFGAAGGAAGYGLGKAIERLTSRGMAVDTIMAALRGSPDDLIREARQAGMSPAELDDVLKDVVRGQAAKNSNVATELVPGVQQRLARANAQTLDDVSRLVSPENSARLIADLQKQGQAIGAAGYQGGAYLNPARVGLVPELAQNPAMADAIKAAEKLASVQGRPFSTADMGIQDLDAIQRALNTYARSMFNSTPENTLLGPEFSGLADDVNRMAVSMAPELGETQAKYAGIKAAQEAVDLGKKALDPAKEFVEVAEEFAGLSPDAQAAYRAGLATRLRTILQHKAPTADSGKAFRATDVIEKLKAVGFPEDAIDEIIKRSAAPRGVLDALQGGSDTARKLAAAKASESSLSKVTPFDLVAGATVHPATVFTLPMLRGAGAAQERRVSEMVLRALTDPTLRQFSSLFASAPQQFTPALSAAGANAGTYGYSPF